MVTDILRVIGQLDDKRLLRPVLLGLLLSALVLAAVVAGSYWLLADLLPTADGWIGRQLAAIGLLELIGSFAAGWLALLLFPAVALTVQSLFVDSVADAVEAKHYPNTPPARAVPIAESVLAAVKLAALVIGINLLLLPVYLILMLIPPTGLILYFAVNGYLVGREYFETVGLRRLTLPEAKLTRRQNRSVIWLDGILLMLFFSVPVLNLAGPTLGTAYMVHRFHRIW
jgi:CysZ protein